MRAAEGGGVRRRTAKVLAWVGIVLLGLPVLLLILVNTPPVTRFALRKVLPMLNEQLNGRLTVEGVSGSLLGNLKLTGVTLRDPEGEIVLQAASAEVGYDILDLLKSKISLGPVILERPLVRLLKSHPGEPYSLIRVFADESGNEKRETGSVNIRIHDIELRDGTVFATVWRDPADPQREGAQPLDTVQLQDVNVTLPLLTYSAGPDVPRAALLQIGSASAWLPDPALELRDLRGNANLDGDSLSIKLETVQLPASRLSVNAWLVTASGRRRYEAEAKVRELTAGDIAALISGADIPADWRLQGTIRAASRQSGMIEVSSPDLELTAAGGTIRGRVTVVGSDNEWGARDSRLEVDGVRVQRLLRAFDVRSSLRATLYGLLTADGQSGSADLRVAGLSGYGVREAASGHVRARGSFDLFSFDTRLSGAMGTVALSGERAGKTIRRVRGELARFDLAAIDSGLPQSHINARFEGDVTFGSMPREGSLRLVVDSSSFAELQVDTAAIIATLHNGLLSLDSLTVRAPGVQATGSGTFGLHEDQTGAITLTLDAPTLSEVEPLLAALTGDSLFDLVGALQVDLRAQGSIRNYTLGLEARGEDLVVKGFGVEELEARAEGMADSLTFGATATVDSVTKVSLGGRLGGRAVGLDTLTIVRGDATWKLEEDPQIEFVQGQLRISNAVLRRDPAFGLVTVAGRIPGDLTINVERLPVGDLLRTGKLDSLPDLTGQATFSRGAWTGSLALLTDGRANPLTVEFATNPLRGRLQADSFDLALIAPLVPSIRRPGGSVNGSVVAEGSIDEPRLTGRIELRDVTASVPATGVRYGDIDGALVFSGDAVTLEGFEVAAGKGRAQLSGHIRFARLNQPELAITAKLERFPVMNRRDFIEATATGEMRLEGSAAGAVLSGNTRVNEGRAYVEKFLRSSGIDLSDPLYAQFVDTSVLRREALSPGLIESFVDTLRIDSLSVDLGDNFFLRSPDASIQLAGRLSVSTGNATEKYQLVGTVRAVRGTYRMALAPGVTREFLLREGTIRYFGVPTSDAILDLEAEHVVRTALGDRVTITAHIEGTIALPTIRLTGDVSPPLSETELISYLVFGAPTVQAFLGREGANSERRSVFEQSAGQLVGVLSGKIESAIVTQLGLPIDYFRIKPGEVQSGLAGTELVLGMQVRILGFPSYLRASPRFCPREQLLSLDHIGINLETRLAPQWGVATSVDPVQGCDAAMAGISAKPYQFGVDLFWEKR